MVVCGGVFSTCPTTVLMGPPLLTTSTLPVCLARTWSSAAVMPATQSA